MSNPKSALKPKRTFSEWIKSRDGQKVIVMTAFMILPLLLLFVFTYLPFGEMFGFSFYNMKYVGARKFVGLKNYAKVFSRKDCFGALKLSLYYMLGSIVQLAIALYLATILSFKVKGGNLFKGFMFFPFLINGIAILRIRGSTTFPWWVHPYGDISGRTWYCSSARSCRWMRNSMRPRP